VRPSLAEHRHLFWYDWGSIFYRGRLDGSPDQQQWRNKLYDDITGPKLQAIVAFGGQAQGGAAALDLAPGRADIRGPAPEQPQPEAPGRRLAPGDRGPSGHRHPRPGSRRGDGHYGTSFKESDYARIPPRDLPFGMPAWFGDDAWGRKAKPRHNNSVDRPGSDLKNTLEWRAPKGVP